MRDVQADDYDFTISVARSKHISHKRQLSGSRYEKKAINYIRQKTGRCLPLSYPHPSPNSNAAAYDKRHVPNDYTQPCL